MIARLEPDVRALRSPLGRMSPLTKLAVAVGWFVVLALTTRIAPPLALAVVVIAVGLVFGRISPRTLGRGLLPLWAVALSVGFFNAIFAAANTDPAAVEVLRLGPLRLTEAGLLGGVGLAARVVAIAAVGVVFAQTTDSTRLVDALVQQARLSERFAYGALAAYQAVPRFAEDLVTLRQARRIRGLPGGWHPRLVVGLLVLAIRHGDRLALAMDARGFGRGPRSRYRVVAWTWLDAVAVVAAVVVAVWLATLPV
ncbi:MAG TPA: energy-coupling factor transporter transmembrane component T [Vitreimonas sp.]|nr:energy-coupling factor transporter transmembrane component T [Vitreimonas sp.]